MLMAQQFQYPLLPDSIKDRRERITYMIDHFWNEQSIGDTANFQSPKLLLDYLYLLQQEDERRIDNNIKSFVSLACKKKQTFGRILFWLDQILYDSYSPQYNEKLYSKVLTEVVASETDSLMKLIPSERLKMMSKNIIGKPANDFAYIDKNGRQHRLYDIEAPLLLLIFNNPDCSLCHLNEERIEQDDFLQDMQSKGILKVLAITPNADINDWEKHEYPIMWLTGFDVDGAIYRNRLYDIQHLPCLYLFDKNKSVLLKEANYERLHDYLERMRIASH